MAAKRSKKKSARRAKVQREFVSEAEEILERMREDLADLLDQRASCAQGGEVDPDLVNRIFRAAHSLKGLAGMFGFDGMSDLAHHLEDVLDGLRLGRMSFDASAVDLLDEAVSLFHTLLQRVDDADFEQQGADAISDLIARIRGSVNETPSEADELAGLDLDPALLRALTEYEEHRLRENLRRGRHLSLVDTTFEIIAFEGGLAELSSAVREVGEVVSTLPSSGEAPESQIRFSLLVATDIDAGQLRARLEFPATAVRSVRAASEASPVPVGDEATAVPEVPTAPVQDARSEAVVAASPGPVPASELPEIESLKSISDTVRVDIRKLDELMNMVGELVIQRGAIDQITTRLCEDAETARIGGELRKVQKVLDRKLKELQAGVLDVRMVPLRQIFEKLSRVVRRLRRDLGKDVKLEFHGADTELDKLIVEQLVDPLMHVARNAFDHAIEDQQERLAAGKPAHGLIEISAFQRGNHVVIEVGDDGRGIDPQKVRAVAVARGLVAPDADLNDKEGFDDFVLTPVDQVELRIRLSRLGVSEIEATDDPILRHGDLELNTATYQAYLAGGPVDLTYMEYELLRFFVEHPNRVWSREQILSKVWGYDYFGGSRTVDVHVRRLRAKLGFDLPSLFGSQPNIARPERGLDLRRVGLRL